MGREWLISVIASARTLLQGAGGAKQSLELEIASALRASQ
jgi:hypothetical protein